jgi:hypothetical protein
MVANRIRSLASKFPLQRDRGDGSGAPTSTVADTLNITVFHVNNQTLVSGLWWDSLEDPRNYMAEARRKGKENGMDILAVRDGKDVSVIQAGFAPKNRGAYTGMYSFGRVMADLLGDNVLAAFKIDSATVVRVDNAGRNVTAHPSEELYALIAILDGSIVADSDMVGDRDTIESKQNELRNAVVGTNLAWRELIAPEGWVNADKTIALEDLITARSLKKEHQLRPLTFGLSKKEITKYAGITAGVVVAIAGIWFLYAHWPFSSHKHHKTAAEQRAEALRAAGGGAVTAGKTTTTAAPAAHDWASVPDVDDVVSTCMARLDAAHLSKGGWPLSEADCDAKGHIGYVYVRTGNLTIDDFRKAVASEDHVPVAVMDNPKTPDASTAGYGGSYTVAAAQDEPLKRTREVIDNFVAHFQRLGVKVTPTFVEPPAPTQPAQDAPSEPQPDWQTYTFSIVLKSGDVMVRDGFAGVQAPGVRVTKITENFQPNTGEMTYTITGNLYAR